MQWQLPELRVHSEKRRERLIKYAINSNWKPHKENQIVRISDSSLIIDELSLRDGLISK